jgi:hypothetical protein
MEIEVQNSCQLRMGICELPDGGILLNKSQGTKKPWEMIYLKVQQENLFLFCGKK